MRKITVRMELVKDPILISLCQLNGVLEGLH
nr:MAG TPA: hypothetical protein [Bacteriophage sp.]DAG25755.1 MAG TPA: hypothetical protein [Bacteriophage sp.]DAH14154.1 MAG TPA: hypothetical protein [Caudoviricetes sp.]